MGKNNYVLVSYWMEDGVFLFLFLERIKKDEFIYIIDLFIVYIYKIIFVEKIELICVELIDDVFG